MPFLLECIARSKMEVCLIVDASGMAFPYNISDVHNTPHVRLHWPLQEEIAPVGVVNLFCDITLQHVLHNPGKVVLLHDREGMDRAGYLLCHYLVRTTLKPLAWVMQSFVQLRPPGFTSDKLPNALASYYPDARSYVQCQFPVWEPVWSAKQEHIIQLGHQAGPHALVCSGVDAYICTQGSVLRTRFVIPPLVQQPTIMALMAPCQGKDCKPGDRLWVTSLHTLHGHQTHTEDVAKQQQLFEQFVLHPRVHDQMNQQYSCYRDAVILAWHGPCVA